MGTFESISHSIKLFTAKITNIMLPFNIFEWFIFNTFQINSSWSFYRLPSVDKSYPQIKIVSYTPLSIVLISMEHVSLVLI